MVIRLMINYFINLKKEAKNVNAGVSGAIFRLFYPAHSD